MPELAKKVLAKMRHESRETGTIDRADPPIPESGAAPRDPLADILATPLKDLTEPLEVASSILGETVCLVANDQQAAAIHAKGGVAYTPAEVAILQDLHAAVPPAVWAERLRLIHRAKREFSGSLDSLRQDPKARLWTLLDTWAEMDEAACPEPNVKALHDHIVDIFRDHPQTDAWLREWRQAHPEAKLS